MSETIAKADRCQALLNDPDLKQAFQDTRDAILRQFEQIPPSDAERLLKCRERLHLLKSVEANLRQAVEDGKLERYFEQEREKPSFLGDITKWRMKRRA